MESVHRERCEDGGSRLGVPIFQRHLSTNQSLTLPDLCSNSSVCKITDETFPYVSGIFDDTIDPSFTSEEPGNNVNQNSRSQLISLTKGQTEVVSGLKSQAKALYSSWLSAPVENGHSMDFSMSITSPPNDQEDFPNITENSSNGGTPDISSHIPESSSCPEVGDKKMDSQSSTLNLTKDLQEKSSELNSTMTHPCLTESNNVTFEKTQEVKETSAPVTPNNGSLETVHEKHLNSTVDICTPSNTATDQPDEKLDHTVDICQSIVSKQETGNEALTNGEDCEKHGTFIKTTEEVSVNLPANSAALHNSTEAGELGPVNVQPADGTFTKHNATTDLTSAGPASKLESDIVNTTMNITKSPNVQLPAQSGADVSDTVGDAPSPGSVNAVPVTMPADTTFTKQNTSTGLASGGPLSNSKNDNMNTTMNITKPSDARLPAQSKAEASATVGDAPGTVNSVPVTMPADRTFTKQNTTTDLTPAGPLSNDSVNTTINMPKPPETQSPPAQSKTVDDVPSPEPVSMVPVVMMNAEVVVCSNNTLELPDSKSKEEEQQGLLRRRNGLSEQDSCLNLDISQSSMFSLDDTIEMRSRALVTSTPIVLGRGFDSLRCAKPMNMQKRLSVINSIETHSKDDLVGEHDGSDPSHSNSASVKSQTQKESTKCTSDSTTSESTAAIKPPSRLAVRRKIPQPSCKSGIPKTQIHPRPPTSQTTPMVVKSKTASTAQAPNQPETSSSALRSVKRTVQHNKGKNVAPAKSALTAGPAKTSSVAASTNGCALPTDSKPVALPKPSGLQPPGRGRFGLKPPGVVVSAESGNSQSNNKPTGLPGVRTRSSLLPGFAQKHASSDALPLAKRKRTDMQDKPSCAEAPASSKPSGGAQRHVTVPKDIKPKKSTPNCGNCTLLQETLHEFHHDLGEFLGQIPSSCENWLQVQRKLETCLEEFKRLQAEH